MEKKKIKLRPFFRRFSVQLPLLFFLAGLAAILVFSGVIYFAISNVFLDETIARTQGMLAMSSTNIENYIDRLKSESGLFANDPALKTYLSQEAPDRGPELNQRIEIMLENNPYIQSIAVVSKDGRIISNEQNLDMSVSEDMMKEKWYMEAIQNNMPVLTGARMQSFLANKDSWVISVSTEVTDEAGENAGVLLVDMKYSVIEDLLLNLDLGKNGYVFVVNDEKELVYHKDTATFKDPQKGAELTKILEQGNYYDREKNLLVNQSNIDNAGWTMVGVVSLDNLIVLKKHLFETVVFTAILLFFAFSFIGIAFTKRLTDPIQRLEKNMLQIEKLAEIEPDKRGFYEMEIFAARYNQMIQRIRRLLKELSKKEEHMHHLELQALMGQINPHFLYNTLDTIVWMAEFNDSKKVIALTKSLAAFFRLSLNGGKEIITVGGELEHVRQYLYIQKERYEDKLEYEVTADESVLGCPMPKLILQPLVENSIYHGIKPLDGPGTLRVSVRDLKDRICLTVSDNGVGFSPSAPIVKKTTTTGVGLNNVRERIALYYQGEGTFTIVSTPGAGCTITIIINKNAKKVESQ